MVLNARILVTLAVIAAAVVMMAQVTLAAGNSGTTKPGWGKGDTNHVHTGPPGQSVRP